ncbi:MAG: C25 family cysteine peptidase [Pyrinomonadaceae bacterium]
MKRRFFGKQRILVAFTILLAFTIIYSQFTNVWNTQAAGTISGRVFQDFNGNGNYETTMTVTNDGSGTIGAAIDRGVQSVQVRAYSAAGTNVTTGGVANTAADGTYSLTTTDAGSGPYRIEFTSLPTGFSPSARSTDSVSGGTATNSGTTVQFASAGATNVNLAVNYPADYSQNNPQVVASLYSQGDQINGVNSGLPVLVSFPYSSGSTDTATGATESLFDSPTVNPLELAANEVGTTYGLAYARKSRLIYTGAFFKRHAGYGPGGPNRIYIVDRAGNGSVTNAFTVPGTSTDAHDTTAPIDWTRDNGNTGWDGVGKTSLGGMALSEDESVLYVMNLANRTLYALNPSNGTQIAAQAAPTNLPLPSGTCAAGDARPFAVSFYHGSLYVGMVCSAESTLTSGTVDTYTDSNANGRYDGGEYYIESNGTAGRQAAEPFMDLDGDTNFDAGEPFVDNDGNGFYNQGDARQLRAYVYSVNPTTLAFGASPVFQMPLNYRRGVATHTAGAFAIWRPWSSTYRDAGSGSFRTVYSQPMLTDIGFDNGNLILGLRDRLGDQIGNGALSNPNDASNTNFYQPRTAGDVIRACGSVGSWTVEANGRCNATGTAPQNVSEGPGGGEFYYGDSYDLQDVYTPSVTINGKGGNHDDTASGGVEQLPGAPDVMITNFDPIPNIGNMVHDGGIRWLNNTNGSFTKAYRLYDGVGSDSNIFGKAGGVGGNLVILPDPAPLEIGNRVWRDTDGDGVQDAGENPISGVTVRLYNSANTLVGTAVTDTNGEYYFVGSTVADANITDNIGQINGGIAYNANYQVRFDLAANYSGAGPLTGLLLTTRDQTSQGGFADGSDSDAGLVTNPTSSPAGTYPVVSVLTGNPGENNHNIDTGFTSSTVYSLGNRVWFDTDNDGQIDAAEVGISNVSVSIFADANADGTPDAIGSPVGTMTTDASGYYRFDNLAAGNYVVRVNPANFANAGVLGGYQNTSGNSNADTDSTSVAGQNGENGINPSGAANLIQTNGILSGSIALGAPGEPVSESDVQASGQGAVDGAANMTVDFGFYRACLSGIVWNDNGAGGNNNNGILNAGEAPIPFVRVRLYDSANAEILVGNDGILGTSDDGTNGMLTNSGGNYNFCGLSPVQYRVVINSPGGTSSTPTSNNPNDNIDSDDNGFTGSAPFVGRIVSGLVTINPGSTGAAGSNTVTNSSALTSDPTVDFGFVLPPTAIKLDSFAAFTDGNTVSLKWSTGGEAANLGFNVYRETNGMRELMNAAPIAGSALRSSVELLASGESYGWTEADASRSAVYYLEDIDIDGTTTMHGPISPVFKVFLNKFDRNSALLSDLTKAQRPSVEKEFVGARESENASISQSAQWQIAARQGVKITVNHDGWYRVPAENLQSAGFDLNTNRDKWQLFVNASEVPFKLENDGSIEFFGRGVDTLDADKQVYYLVNGQTTGLRVAEVKAGDVSANPAQSFRATVERKDRLMYVSSILNGETENWFGAIINRNSQTVQNLTVSKLDSSNQARLSVKLQGLTAGQHVVSVRFNDIDLGTVYLGDQDNNQFEFDIPASSVIEGVNSVKLQSVGEGNDVNLVDKVSLTYSRRYEAVNNKLRFSVAAGQTVRVGGFTTGKMTVYEIQNGKVSRQLAFGVDDANGEYSFGLGSAGYDREFIALPNSQPEQAALIQQNVPSSWNASGNRADFVIIAPSILQTQAQQLADMRQNQGLVTKVVLAEDVADEFGSGVLTSDAVRAFLQRATTAWRIKPQYALLFGDSSFDPRSYLGQSNRNLVPTKLIDTDYMETSSDAWLADFDGDGVEDIALGRLPASSETEANLMVSKLARYDNQQARTEKTNLMVADTGFESYSQSLQSYLPNDVRAIRIDRAAMTDAEMRGQILNGLNDNPMMVTYTGHGTTGVWSNSAIFNYADAANLSNSQLSFFMLMTCLNGFTHNTSGDSLAEAALKAENGGAVVIWASSGMTLADPQYDMSREATRLLFGGGQLRIGDIARMAKQSTTDSDVRRTWQIIGDPTIFVK